ncbi:MAG: OmpA family protein [Candidatus Gastranaerophilaceae bacterium]
MAIRYRGKISSDDGDNNNVFWTTMSDLMLGLAIIFITMFVLAMTGFSQQNIEQQKVQMDVSKKISEELKKSDIDADIDKMTGDLKISDGELFELNSYVLTPEGKKLLDKLAPIYINTIFADKELAGQIDNIVIQGHTDSQMFAGVNSKDQQFMRNMDLSLKRANAVAEYLFNTGYDKKYADAFRKKLVVEGKSFNEPVLVNGKEDYNKSRRVELKLKIKDWNVSTALGLRKN